MLVFTFPFFMLFRANVEHAWNILTVLVYSVFRLVLPRASDLMDY